MWTWTPENKNDKIKQTIPKFKSQNKTFQNPNFEDQKVSPQI